MEGQFVVLRTDLVVFIPGWDIPPEAAAHLTEEWKRATAGDVRIVVLRGPVRVVDLRETDPDLIAFGQRLAERLAAVPA